MTKKIMKALTEIQSKLKAPKGNYNNFGKYKYRSAEDILEAVKPLLKEQNAALLLADQIELVGARFYVKATAKLFVDDESIEVSAYAREDENKKGMDGSQVTGASSSYARKYALNGLFLIDDNKDADTDEYRHTQDNAPAQTQPQQYKMTEQQYNQIMNGIAEVAQISQGDPAKIQNAVLQVVQSNNVAEFDPRQFAAAVEYLNALKIKAQQKGQKAQQTQNPDPVEGLEKRQDFDMNDI